MINNMICECHMCYIRLLKKKHVCYGCGKSLKPSGNQHICCWSEHDWPLVDKTKEEHVLEEMLKNRSFKYHMCRKARRSVCIC